MLAPKEGRTTYQRLLEIHALSVLRRGNADRHLRVDSELLLPGDEDATDPDTTRLKL